MIMLCMKEDLQGQRSMHLDVKSSKSLLGNSVTECTPIFMSGVQSQRVCVCERERERVIVWGPLFISIYSSK